MVTQPQHGTCFIIQGLVISIYMDQNCLVISCKYQHLYDSKFRKWDFQDLFMPSMVGLSNPIPRQGKMPHLLRGQFTLPHFQWYMLKKSKACSTGMQPSAVRGNPMPPQRVAANSKDLLMPGRVGLSNPTPRQGKIPHLLRGQFTHPRFQWCVLKKSKACSTYFQPSTVRGSPMPPQRIAANSKDLFMPGMVGLSNPSPRQGKMHHLLRGQFTLLHFQWCVLKKSKACSTFFSPPQWEAI